MTKPKVSAVTRLDVSESIKNFGIQQGDVLYIRAGLAKIGKLDGNVADVVLGGILDALGPEGTLILPAFTQQSEIWHKDVVLFNNNSATNTGALSKYLLRNDHSIRSQHPSHSFVAIGKYASYLLETHNRNTSCFEPMRRLIELKGKMILFGCVKESPGFSTVHLAQYDLGLSQQHYLKFIFKVKILVAGKEKIYRPHESPGCSVGFSNFYKNYINSENLVTGKVGQAWGLKVDAEQAYRLEKKILSINPRYTVCDDFTCISCHIFRGYNKRNIPIAIISIIKKIISSMFKRKSN